MGKLLKGKVAVITGAARGIGKVTADTLARAGAGVALLDVMEGELEVAAREVGGRGVEAIAYTCDVTNADDVNSTMKKVVSEMGRIDILVNNAGITRDNLLLRMSDEDWEKVLSINLRGAFFCTRAAVRYMLKQKNGKIVNMASIVGVIGNAGQCNYSASKAGLIGLTKSAARELASRNISVNAIAPGYIGTAMTEKLSDDTRQKVISGIPLGRIGEPQDVANAVLFLAGAGSNYITGHVLHVDGGMAM